MLPNDKAGNILKKANSETNRAIQAGLLTRKTTQVTHVAPEGKLRAKTGRNTQTNITSDHRAGKSGKAAKGPDFRIHQTRPDGTYFESNYGR
jgi:hypothetical protein